MTNINTDDPNDEPSQAEIDAYELGEMMAHFSAMFDAAQQAVRDEDEPFNFLASDVIDEMMGTLVELALQCRLQYIKLAILQNALGADPRLMDMQQPSGDIQIGWPKPDGGTGWGTMAQEGLGE